MIMRTRSFLRIAGVPLLLLLCSSLVAESTHSLHFPGLSKRNTETHQEHNDKALDKRYPQDHSVVCNHDHSNEEDMNKVGLAFTARCTCGKVKVAIETLERAPPLRLVCYCADCRGYYETLDRLAIEKGLPPTAFLDNWGGVDWTAMYPRDITILQGKDLLQTTIIRPTSGVRQVYTTCCHTPMFRFGELSVMMNSNLIPPETKAQLPIEFRIIGRNAWKDTKDAGSTSEQALEKRPKISWSVPFRWFWTMFPRVKKDLMIPMPFDVPTGAEVKEGKVPVLKGFKEGSM